MNSQLHSLPAAAPKLLLFGTPELHAGAVTPFLPERRFQLIALLALHSGEWIPRDRIAALFWPEHGNADARRNLRKVLFKTHGLPGAQTVDASEHALRWTVATDLQDFNSAIAARRFDVATGLRRGPLLAGIDDADNSAWADWLAAERSRWHLAWHQAALDDLRQRSQPEQRIAAAEALLQTDPFDEAALAALIDAQLALGHAGRARRSYADYAARLAEELGVEPTRSLRDRIGDAVASTGRHRPEAEVLGQRAALLLSRSSTQPGPLVPNAPIAPIAPTAQGTQGAPGVPPAAASPPSAGFIGRRTELANLGLLLASRDCRLVTILGPGGIGKSSLARRALAAVGALFPGGTWWVDLQDLADIHALVARLAQLLRVEISDTRDPVEQLARRLGRERSLLVLDNAEHLAELPALVDGLLAAAGSLSLLLTSRARTHSAHEHLLPLAGLDVPDEDSRDLDAASHFDAVRLFELRAMAAQRGFGLAGHLRAVIEILDAVAGLPLAIELAASWVRLLPPEAIARDLRSSIDLLERDPALPGQPARPEHHSMRAVLDHSWQLLAPRERLALAALSVLQGGFTRHAAQRVTAAALPLLSSLADKSLISADASGRFGIHPLVAAYAAQQLEANAPLAIEMRRKHAEFFALHLAALAPHAIGDQRLLVAGVTAEFANCRAAWLSAVELQRADLVYAMVRALWSFFENRGRLREGIELLSPALALPDRGPATQRAKARLHHGLSMLHQRKGDALEALEIARSGITGAENCGDTEAYVGCVMCTAICFWYAGQLQETRVWLERALAISRARDDRLCIARSLGNLGNLFVALGQAEPARDLLTQALAGSRELGDQYTVCLRLNNLGLLCCDLGDWPAALQMFAEGMRHCAGYGIESLSRTMQLGHGQALYGSGQIAAARANYEAALIDGREHGIGIIEWGAELGLARIEIDAAEIDAAVQRLHRVVQSARASSSQRNVVAAASLYGDIRAARGDAAAAVQIWRMALLQGNLYAAQQRAIEIQFAALVAEPQGDAASPALSLAEVLRQIESEASRPAATRPR